MNARELEVEVVPPTHRVQVVDRATDDGEILTSVQVDGAQIGLFLERERAEQFAAGFRLGLNYDLPF